MEITEEIKAKVFAQYLGQKTLFGDERIGSVQTLCADNLVMAVAKFKLILKPLSAITDEDAEWVAKEAGISKFAYTNREQFVPFFLSAMEKGTVNFKICQYLQSKGYDLPNYLLGGKTLREAGLTTK